MIGHLRGMTALLNDLDPDLAAEVGARLDEIEEGQEEPSDHDSLLG